MRLSRPVLHGNVWATILAQWQALGRAAPHTKLAEARQLLASTVSHVGGAPPDDEPTTAYTITEAGSRLLGDRDHSTRIWQTLRRHRVSWEDTLALFSQQCAYLSVAQAASARRYVQQHAPPPPHTLAVLRAWERVEDAGLVACYRQLQRTTSVVAYAKLVSAALRSRPQLHGVLPVTRGTLEHLYTLASAADTDTPAGAADRTLHAPHDAAIALELCAHMALLQSASLSVRAKEALDLRYAQLQARTGNWTAALSAVEHSPTVRASAKVAWRSFVAARHLWEEALRTASPLHKATRSQTTTTMTTTTPTTTTTAILAAPRWQQALAVLHAVAAEDRSSSLYSAAATAFLSRADTAGSAGALDWREQVRCLDSIAPADQTFAVARTVLAAVPPDDPQYLATAVAVLRPSTTRMYAGTLARRYHSALRSGDWGTALALSLASDAFDLASAVLAVPEAACQWDGPGSAHRHPPAWRLYEALRRTLTETAAGIAAKGSLSVADLVAREGPRCTTTPEKVAVLLAVLLHGGDEAWRVVVKDPLCHAHPRLRAYATACQLQSTAHTTESPASLDAALRSQVECFLFARASDTTLVASWAPAKVRAYFLTVLPPALRTTLRHALTRVAARVPPATTAVKTRHSTPPLPSTPPPPPDTIEATMAMALPLLSRPTEPRPLQRFACAAASGDLSLVPSACRPGLSLAALTAGATLDATASVTAAASLSMALRLPHPAAMQQTIAAQLLLGQWQRALHELGLWRAELARTGALPSQLPRVLDTTRLCACHAPRDVAMALVTAALGEATVCASSAVRPHAALLQAVLDLLATADTRQVEAVLAAEPKPTARLKRKALSAAFCLLSETEALSRVLCAAGQDRVGVLDLDDHATQRLLRVLPLNTAVSALATLSTHHRQRVIHEHWVVQLASRCPLRADTIHDDAPAPVLETLHRTQPHSLVVSAVMTAKAHARAGDLLGFLVALNRLTGFFLWASYDGRQHGSARPLLPHAVSSLVYLLRDMLSCTEAALRRTDDTRDVEQQALWLYHTLCRDPQLTRALLDRGGGRLASLTATHHRPGQGSLTPPPSSASSVARAVLLLGYVHRVLARHQRIPIAATMPSRQLRLCAEVCPEAWQVAVHLFRQLRTPRLEECEAFFTTLAHAPAEEGALAVPLSALVRALPEQALIWAPTPTTRASAVLPRWQHALQLLRARRTLLSSGPGDADKTSQKEDRKAAFKRELQTHLDALTPEGGEAVRRCLLSAGPAPSRHPRPTQDQQNRSSPALPGQKDWVRRFLLSQLKPPHHLPHHHITS